MALGRLGRNSPWIYLGGFIGITVLSYFLTALFNTVISQILISHSDINFYETEKGIITSSLIYFVTTVGSFSCLFWFTQKYIRQRPFKDVLTAGPKFKLGRLLLAMLISLAIFFLVLLLAWASNPVEFGNQFSLNKTSLDTDMIIFKVMILPLVLIFLLFSVVFYTAFLRGFILQGLSYHFKSPIVIVLFCGVASTVFYFFGPISSMQTNLFEILSVLGFGCLAAYLAMLENGLEVICGIVFAEVVFSEIIFETWVSWLTYYGLFQNLGFIDSFSDLAFDLIRYAIIASVFYKLSKPPTAQDYIESIYD